MKKQGSQWSSTKARLVLAALLRHGWQIKRQRGSHRLLTKSGWPDYTFAYHDRVELGRGALELLRKKTGLRPQDL
jgi:predicted RNA binding protein YcfA (HicA-like mRNA interferase family)